MSEGLLGLFHVFYGLLLNPFPWLWWCWGGWRSVRFWIWGDMNQLLLGLRLWGNPWDVPIPLDIVYYIYYSLSHMFLDSE